MAIHFTMGGPVISTAALKPTTCITHTYDVEFEITVTWKGECVDTATLTVNDCPLNTVFCIPRGDYRRIIVNVVDREGAAVDVSGFTPVEYVIAPDVDTAPTISKTLGSGIAIGGDNASFVITLTEAETKIITDEYVYHEFRATNGGEGQTMFAGVFRSPKTILGTD